MEEGHSPLQDSRKERTQGEEGPCDAATQQVQASWKGTCPQHLGDGVAVFEDGGHTELVRWREQESRKWGSVGRRPVEWFSRQSR